MKRFTLSICSLCLTLGTASAQTNSVGGGGGYTVDTLFYDKEWKGVPESVFAVYRRVILTSEDPGYANKFRDFFISSGNLQGEGGFISIDKSDDSESIWDGECFDYYENGLVWKHAKFSGGRMTGIYSEFSEDGGMCYQLEYTDGRPQPYYTLSSHDGYTSKFNLADDTPLFEQPALDEKKTEYRDGDACPYYIKNGLRISMTNSVVSDYGRYYKLSLVIANNSVVPFDFDPADIVAVLTNPTGERVEIPVLGSDEYLTKVRRRQNWSLAMTAFAQGMAASSAGFSSSNTNIHTNYGGLSGSSGIYGTTGYWGVGSYGGYANSSAQTVSYNGAAAYQAQILASQQVAQYSYALNEERAVKEEGYLKLTTINPGEVVSGYVHVARQRGSELNVIVFINGIGYEFPWSLE